MQAGLRLVYNNNELGKFIDNKLMRIAHIKHLMQLLSIYHCVILNFQTPMSFPYFRQVQAYEPVKDDWYELSCD